MDKNRVYSIDLLRGLVMIIMALDHVRDYFHMDAHYFDPSDPVKTTAMLFFMRWVTHFCAPVFVLLAGVSAFLYGRNKTKKELSRYLFVRGLWLILMEITILNFAWTFNIQFTYLSLSVVWALGISMLFLSVLIFLPPQFILAIGLLLTFTHNLLDKVHVPGNGPSAFVWAVSHERKTFNYGDFNIKASYPVLPWIGVMAVGYVLGMLYAPAVSAKHREKVLMYSGMAAIMLFVALRAINIYGDLMPRQRGLLSFMNVTKYPPSLDYLLATIGPALIFLSFAEGPLNRTKKAIITYGRVPFFYYAMHLYIIHFFASLAATLTGFGWHSMVLMHAGVTSSPRLKGYGFSLPVVYAMWILVVAGMYPLCKWYGKFKQSHKQYRVLKYL